MCPCHLQKSVSTEEIIEMNLNVILQRHCVAETQQEFLPNYSAHVPGKVTSARC